MIAVVAGSRSHKLTSAGKEALFNTLIEHRSLIIFHGGATGVDESAKDFVESKNFLTIPFYANWAKYGKYAGPKRNELMVKYASRDKEAIWVGFHGGRGTANCKNFAEKCGLKIIDLSGP